MALVVNTNISSINAQNNLYKVQKSMSTSLERLSSGLRINHSSDDAAGLAIATGMRSQVQGLQQAVRNAGDGLSALTTADGAIAEETTILQRIRVLAVQAANEVNSSANLESIQEEIDQEIAELTRIGSLTDFNGQNLINGTFTNKSIQVGAFADQTIDISIEDFRATDMGAFVKLEGAVGTLSANSAIAGGGDLTIAGVEIGPTTADNVSHDTLSMHSAIAKANAINEKTSETGVTASVGAAVLEGGAAVGATTVGAGASLTINGVTIVDEATSVGPAAYLDDDSDSALRNAINVASRETGVVATLNGDNEIVLTAEDGRNIVVDGVGNAATGAGFAAALGSSALGASAANQATGTLTLHSNEAFQIANAQDDQLGITANTYATLDQTKTVQLIDVTADGGASDAIRTVDAAISKITSEQAKIGAQVNRFEHIISNLNISIENMSAAESRIRDTDFAMETANLTKTQIIQQAGTAMLSQANMRPQAALSLLG